MAVVLMATGCAPPPTAATNAPSPSPHVAAPTIESPPPAIVPPTVEPAPPPPTALPTAPPMAKPDPPPPSDPTAPSATAPTPTPETIGLSAGGRPIAVHRLGRGAGHVVLVGGIHGGYEWNSILLVERLLAYFQAHEAAIPPALTLHVIPNANPDGLYAVTGFDGPFAPGDIAADSTPGRFNGNGVDLNRNWDCNWSPTAYWRDRLVPAGAEPFSEPESRALRDYLVARDPVAVLFFHSAAGVVYVSGCPEPHPPSEALALVYGRAAGYPVHLVFDHYAITGDAGDWLTTQGIASFTVELVTHESLDWEQNLAGLMALLDELGRRPGATDFDWNGPNRIE